MRHSYKFETAGRLRDLLAQRTELALHIFSYCRSPAKTSAEDEADEPT